MTAVPTVVNIAFWILMTGEVLGAADAIVYFWTTNWSSFLQGWGWIAATLVVALWALLVGGVVFFFWVALLVRWGVPWARIVTTIGGAVSVVASVVSGDLIQVALSAANVVAVVLVWLPTSRAFFAAVRGIQGRRVLLARMLRTRAHASAPA